MRTLLIVLLSVSAILAETIIASATTTLTFNTNTYSYLTTLTITNLFKPVYKLVYVKGIYTLMDIVTMPYYQAYTAKCTGKAIVAIPTLTLELVGPVLAATIFNLTTAVKQSQYTITVAQPFSLVLTDSVFLTTTTVATLSPLSTTVTSPREAYLLGSATVIPYPALTCTYNAPYNVTYYVLNTNVESTGNIVVVYKDPITATVRVSTKYSALQTFPVKAVANGTVSVAVYQVNYHYTQLPRNGVPTLSLIALFLTKALTRGKRGGLHKRKRG